MIIEQGRIQLAADYIGYKPDRRFAKSHGRERKRKYEVNQLWEVHHEIIRGVALGEKNADIARDLGMTQAAVSYTRN